MGQSLCDEVNFSDGVSPAYSVVRFLSVATSVQPPPPFAAYWTDAFEGQRLIDDEAERGVRTWASPTELAHLLLMRRDPRTTYLKRSGNIRLLGAIVPEIDAVLDSEISLPSPTNPILPLWLRPALLAGVRSSNAKDRPCWQGSKAKPLVKTARVFASSPRPCSALHPSPLHYHYCSIIDNMSPKDSQISCSNVREPAHSCN